MEEHSPQILEYAELLLDEEKKQEARLLLAAYLKRSPESADAWWLMSRSVEDEQQELDCLRRVLQYAPSYEPARLRMQALTASRGQAAAPPANAVPAASTTPPTQQAPASSPPQAASPASQEKSTSAPPFTPPVSPFVFPDVEPAAAEQPFDLFAPGAFAGLTAAPAASATPPAAPPEAAPQAVTPEPAPEEKEEVPDWALPPDKQAPPPAGPAPAPKKKKTWIVDAVIIGIVLCIVLTVVAYFLLRDYAESIIGNFQSTQETGLVLTSRPPNTLEPTWTASVTFTPPPPTATPETPTPTETPLYTPENTPIPTGAIGLTAGMFPPDFTLAELVSGEQFTLSETRGQPVLIFFFTTWCPYCEDEVSDLQDLYEKYQEDGLILLAVNEGETLEEVDAYRLEHGLTFPLLTDTDRAVSILYDAESIPHHVFIGVSGKIMYAVTGQLVYQDLENKIKATMRVFPTATP